MNNAFFHIQDVETGEKFQWDIDEVLEEINRNHSADYVPYNNFDAVEGWFEWCEGEYLTLNKITFNNE